MNTTTTGANSGAKRDGAKTIFVVATSFAIFAISLFVLVVWIVTSNADTEISRDAGAFQERLISESPTGGPPGSGTAPSAVTGSSGGSPAVSSPSGTKRLLYKTSNMQMEVLVPDLDHPINAPTNTVRGDGTPGDPPIDDGVQPDR